MTLKTSSRNINPFWNMIGFTLRKNIGLIVVISIAALVYFPGSFIVDYENIYLSAHDNVNNYLLKNLGVVVTLFSAIIAVLFNMLNFGFLYKKSSSDVFHAFPLTRSELLLSRFLSGIIATLIPVFICYTAFGILMLFNSWMGSFTGLFFYLLHTIIIILVCSSFSMIFVVCAGSAFDLGVSLIGGNLALLAVGWIIESILDETLIGFTGYRTSEIMYNLSPPNFCGVGLEAVDNILRNNFTKGANIEFLIRSIIYIAVFTVASVLLYNRRKAEKGGTAYAYKFMYLGCSLLAGICGGFVLGMIFDGNVTSIAFWFFAIIGCLLTSVIYGTVTDRGFKGVVKSIIMGSLSVVVLISVAVIGVTGGFGYTNRIPQAEKVKSVSVHVFGETIPFDNPQQVIALHKAILDTDATNYDDYKEIVYDGDYTDYKYTETEYITIDYELKNGKSMSRNFTVEAEKVMSQLLDIYKSDERLDMINEHIDVVDAEEINLYFRYNEEYYSVDITDEETQEFLKAYWQDVQSTDGLIFTLNDCHFIEINGDKRIDNNRTEYFNFQFEWYDDFTNTKQFIEDHELIMRSKENQNDQKF